MMAGHVFGYQTSTYDARNIVKSVEDLDANPFYIDMKINGTVDRYIHPQHSMLHYSEFNVGKVGSLVSEMFVP